ncbi:hypothetical protein [Ensifer soli]|uniref:hypothetical protein n=1 Tax=Ciceribacter sp. sgz301302 TaxID=3342379 RepID=UPI0035B8DD9B
MNYLWLLVVAGGAAALGLALLYGTLRDRRLSPREKTAQRERLREVYGSTSPPTHPDGEGAGGTTRGVLAGALLVFAVIAGVTYLLSLQPAVDGAHTASTEAQRDLPAGPADTKPLPGNLNRGE